MNERVEFVATPNYDTFIVPGSDFETLQPILRRRKKSLKNHLYISLGFTAFIVCIALLANSGSVEALLKENFVVLNVMIFGIIPILNSIYELNLINKVNESNYLKESDELRFEHWIKQESLVSIYVITGVLVVITLLQFITGLNDSIESVGLVKPKTVEGEYWRLLTCTLLHGSIMHIVFNGGAIFVIGRMLIRISGLSFFMIVFLVSGIIGSLFSLVFIPEITSVGASGGIMGLVGFLLVMSFKFKDNIPRNILKSMLITVFLVALIGISAYSLIDNAAHVGGLLGGVLVGVLSINTQKKYIPYKPTFIVNVLGVISALILISGVIIIFFKI